MKIHYVIAMHLTRWQANFYDFSGISTRTMHQSTTPSLSQTIWPRWASRHFFTLPIFRTLLSVTFGYSLSSEAVVMRELRRWKRLWRKSLIRSHKRTSMGPHFCWQLDERLSTCTNLIGYKTPISVSLI